MSGFCASTCSAQRNHHGHVSARAHLVNMVMLLRKTHGCAHIITETRLRKESALRTCMAMSPRNHNIMIMIEVVLLRKQRALLIIQVVPLRKQRALLNIRAGLCASRGRCSTSGPCLCASNGRFSTSWSCFYTGTRFCSMAAGHCG